MAKSDSFFIRASTVIGNTTAFNQEEISLGAYVSALGKSVLRIHNIAVSMTDATGTSATLKDDESAAAQFQLTTQSQDDTVLPSNRAVIASGMVNCVNQEGGASVASVVSQDFDNLPQLWTNGYLVATESIYLGGEASAGFAEPVTCSIVMECTVETMTQASAMALSLSQQ
ncbi:MAG: hypothetical protein [Circular genetic element sp.]|nr:MAG: hypothetical protein [Circular genetic element sp.]|tara:strand:- start:986 stop:1498 length:513 start_codon:yes stop_codon:yes gene_type:complete